MNVSSPIVLIIAGTLCLVNLTISVLVLLSRYYSWPQKLAQCAIVWVVPIIGPVAIWAFLRAQGESDTFDTRAYPEPSQKMAAVEVDNAIHDSFGGGGDGGGGGGD
jgi:hypothetical protein